MEDSSLHHRDLSMADVVWCVMDTMRDGVCPVGAPVRWSGVVGLVSSRQLVLPLTAAARHIAGAVCGAACWRVPEI